MKIVLVFILHWMGCPSPISFTLHTLACSATHNIHPISNISPTNPYTNIKIRISSPYPNAIMKVYFTPPQYDHEYEFNSQTTSDNSLVDFDSLFVHSSQQDVSFQTHQDVWVVVYRYEQQNFKYRTTDITLPQKCQTISYQLNVTTTPDPLIPTCLNNGFVYKGACLCLDSYTLDNCQVLYNYLSQAGSQKIINAGSSHYYYFRNLYSSEGIQVTINFATDSNDTNMLIAIENGTFPTTIASIFNQLNPQHHTLTIQKSHLLLITIFQPEPTDARYQISVSIPEAENTLLFILLLSIGGLFFIGIVGGCIVFWKTQSSRKKITSNCIIEEESIFPIISFEMFTKCIGQPDHENCVICLDDFKPESSIKFTVCGHLLHANCLEGWLDKQENCPLCREEFSKQNLMGWEEKLNFHFYDEYQRFKLKKQKRTRNVENQQTLTTIRQKRNIQLSMENNENYTEIEEYAIQLYNLIYLFHRKHRNTAEPEEIVFDADLPSKEQLSAPVFSPQIKRSFKISSRRVHNQMMIEDFEEPKNSINGEEIN